MSHLYGESELADIARPFEEHALDALRRGDLARVRELLIEMKNGPAGLDGLFGHTLARKAAKLRRDFGEEEALAMLARIGAELMRTWTRQYRDGDERAAIADLIGIFREQYGAKLAPLAEDDDEVVLDMALCGSGGKLEKAGLPRKHPDLYAGWRDGVSSFCQICKACQHALNDAVGGDVWTTEKGADGACRATFRKTAARGEVLFTAEERRALTQTRVDRALERLDAGESDIEYLLPGQRKDWKPWHDFGVVMLQYFYAVALEKGGADYLREMLAETYEPAFHAGFPRYAAMTDDELVREIARTWNYHCADFTITEEDERFVFRLDPCGSGGRMFRGEMWRDMFHYGGPLAATMREPHDVNFNRTDAPTYCTHCAASNRAQLESALSPETPLFFVIDGRRQTRPGAACATFVYKTTANRMNLDPELFRQIGLTPPREVAR
ncbi:hypothetical protein [Bradyrhizobium sp.]|uniref:hypothetical protein n=1 Tax=Bradyrhizobium sp. TaxID=376 RepID=UPI00239AD112|nr:hypothetical protein [Bradyrhizobium sp.]MDE2378826.1 hypothetical protein [Bradyrhizobium sp.]